MPAPDHAPAPLRVVLCDDAVAYPMMVQAWFRPLDGFDLVAVVGSLAELRDRIAELAADAVLLDVVLPDGEVDAGLVAAVRAGSGPAVRIVLVSNHLPEDLAVIAAEVGADAWCSKVAGLDGLLVALQG